MQAVRVSVCAADLHSSVAVNTHAENHFDDVVLNTAALEQWVIHQKLQLLVLKPSAPNPSTEWFNKLSQETVCTHTLCTIQVAQLYNTHISSVAYYWKLHKNTGAFIIKTHKWNGFEAYALRCLPPTHEKCLVKAILGEKRVWLVIFG